MLAILNPVSSGLDGSCIHIDLRSAGWDRHRRPDLVCNLMDDAARASPGPAACRREGGARHVVWQVSGRGGKIIFRCSAKQTGRYNRSDQYLCAYKPNTPYIIATSGRGCRHCVPHHNRCISCSKHYIGRNAGELDRQTRRSAPRFQRGVSERAAADILIVLNWRGVLMLFLRRCGGKAGCAVCLMTLSVGVASGHATEPPVEWPVSARFAHSRASRRGRLTEPYRPFSLGAETGLRAHKRPSLWRRDRFRRSPATDVCATSDPGRPLPFSGAGKVMEAQLPIDRNNNK